MSLLWRAAHLRLGGLEKTQVGAALMLYRVAHRDRTAAGLLTEGTAPRLLAHAVVLRAP